MSSHIITFGASLAAGVISGVLASYLFLVCFMKRKRPKIVISDYISKEEIDGETNYLFKFVNKTKSEIFDVRIEPTFYKPFGDMNGTNLRSKDIKLKDNFISNIPCKSVSDAHNIHAMRIRTVEKLEEKWGDESSFIRLTIIAKHSLSGLNKVFVKDFHSKGCIVTKRFQSGDDLGVK